MGSPAMVTVGIILDALETPSRAFKNALFFGKLFKRDASAIGCHEIQPEKKSADTTPLTMSYAAMDSQPM